MSKILIKLSSMSLLAALSCIMASCQKDFPLKGLPKEPKLFIECTPGMVSKMNTKDMDIVSLPDLECTPLPIQGLSFEAMLAKPAGGNIDGLNIGDIRAALTVNGESAELSKAVVPEKNAKKAVFSSTATLRPGDRLSLDASLEGVKSVHAESVIPKPITGIKASLEYIDEILIARITLPDDPRSDDFFAIGINYKASGKVKELDIEAPDYNDFPELVNSCSLLLQNFFAIFNDGGSHSGERTVNLTATAVPISNGTDPIYYQIICCKLSPEYFYYIRSQNQASNNILGQLGFAPGIFSYTNISGGTGVLGGMAMSVTGWILESELEKN